MLIHIRIDDALIEKLDRFAAGAKQSRASMAGILLESVLEASPEDRFDGLMVPDDAILRATAERASEHAASAFTQPRRRIA